MIAQGQCGDSSLISLAGHPLLFCHNEVINVPCSRGISSLSVSMACKMVLTSALSFPSLHLCLCQGFFGMECPKLVIRNSCRNKRKTSSKNK